MFDDQRSFLTGPFLRSVFDLEYRIYVADGTDVATLARLNKWNDRPRLSETQDEAAFLHTFFEELWGYGAAGRTPAAEQTMLPRYRVRGEGAGGGNGEADLALGWFRGIADAVPQVLCEFKDIGTDLDARQNRKGNNRSPVQQCLNYIRGARRELVGNEPSLPWWGLVTDMNEFRLYWWDRAPDQFVRFVIRRRNLLDASDLLSDGEEARFDRFLFKKLLSRDFLIAPAGKPPLLRVIERQWGSERAIEGVFYDRYKSARERLYNVLVTNNPGFPGTQTDLLRLSQKLLDRFIFAFYCEDMGERMLFPPQFIRDYLRSRSIEPYYDTQGAELWEFFKRLFGFMDRGGMFGATRVPRINGGLFAQDPILDGLTLPNHVFVAPGQGANDASIDSDTSTIFHLCARYNYASRGDARESLSLYTLGRIFEQSITELEYRVGEIENRDTVVKLSKRKRDGVYYTPEWVVDILVSQAMDPWFANAKAASGYPPGDEAPPSPDAACAYALRLARIRIVDPACGSGAFLIAAFRRLLDERIAAERDRARVSGTGAATVIDEQPLIASILAENIYGVDINASAVEIAKLALWLHSARAEAPLSSLDHTIRCGNSLVGRDFPSRDGEAEERINPFDWRGAFPEVWPGSTEDGFDIVLGNPPYVKLQNLRKADPGIADYLQARRGEDSYASATTGNFDLYLPFIEKGLRLLAPGGRMAYIAPSLWAVNEYGAGLRALVRRSRHLERWTDFRSFQVFDEATTYTALQIFTREPTAMVQIALAPDGATRNIDWSSDQLALAWDKFPDDAPWLMVTGADRALIDRLAIDCRRLDDPGVTKAIIVGIQTSADKIFHMRRLGEGRYLCRPAANAEYEVAIEDTIMKPLVSGTEAKRYEAPDTEIYLLFPYERTASGVMKLITPERLSTSFPNALQYLRSYEEPLRQRENGKMDNDKWYAYVYPKNLDKQDMAKLIVPRIVESLKFAIDDEGKYWLDNVDVGGVLAADAAMLSFIAAAMNGPVANLIFRLIAKPFRGDYRSANKQFIAPLPMPPADPSQRAEIGDRARSLQTRWTRRRTLERAARDRLSVMARARNPAGWLWPDLPDIESAANSAPPQLRLQTVRREWATKHIVDLEEARLAEFQTVLNRGGRLEARFEDGELRLLSDGANALSRIFLENTEGRLVEAWWRLRLLTQPIHDARSLSADLRRAPAGGESPAARQFIERVAALAVECAAIAAEEQAMNDRLADLYGLSASERILVDGARVRRIAR